MARRLLTLVWTLARLSRVLLLSLLCALPLLVRGALSPSTGPRILRWYFQICGGGYVKFGQLLATRYDLLSDAYCEELGKLLDSLPPVATKIIRRSIEQELKTSLIEIFDEFEEAPIATASLAQVHGAQLRDGTRVVIKVLKPNVERTLKIDIICFRFTARSLDVLPVLRGLDVSGLVNDLANSALEEVDLRREARNTSFIRRRMMDDPIAHYAPRVYHELSTRRVLTLERIYGVSVREIIGAINRKDDAALTAWAAMGITPRRTAIILLRSVLEQTMRFRTFNADPHPSNLIVMPGGTLTWVDFGLVGWIDERQWNLQIRLRNSFARGHAHDAYLAMLQSMEPIPERKDLRAFEQDIKRSIRDYLIASEDPDGSIIDKSAGVFLLRTLKALRRSRLPMTASTASLYRTILIADMVMLRLYPEIDWTGHLRRFLRDISSDLVRHAIETQFSSAFTAFQLARTPLAVAQTVEWAVDRLPQLGRATLHSLSSWERIVLAVLRLLRGSAAVAIVVAATLTFLPRQFVSRAGLGGFAQLVQDKTWPTLAVCVILLFTLGSLIRRAEST